MLSAAILIVYWPILMGLVNQWATDENFSHGFLIPPVALYFAWQRRAALKAAHRQPSGWGLPVAALAICMWAAGTMAAELFLARVSLVMLLAGCILFLYGRAWLRVISFPLGFLLLMVPPPALLFNQIALPLQLFASQVAEVALRACGVPILRDGNVLELVGMRLEVAEACSGIRSIVALFAFALALDHLSGSTWPRQVGLVAATVPIAILANAGRVVATGFAAQVWGPAVADGALHTVAGALVFVSGVVAVAALERATRWRPLLAHS
jgi:exosortase